MSRSYKHSSFFGLSVNSCSKWKKSWHSRRRALERSQGINEFSHEISKHIAGNLYNSPKDGKYWYKSPKDIVSHALKYSLIFYNIKPDRCFMKAYRK